MELTRDHVQDWLNRYVAAWKSYDPAQIADLFSEDVSYHYRPFEEPVLGRAALVQAWLQDRDAEGTYDAHYAPLVIEGNTAVTNGRSTYYTAPGGPVRLVFDNIFVLRFDDDGRVAEYREWWYASPDNAR